MNISAGQHQIPADKDKTATNILPDTQATAEYKYVLGVRKNRYGYHQLGAVTLSHFKARTQRAASLFKDLEFLSRSWLILSL